MGIFVPLLQTSMVFVEHPFNDYSLCFPGCSSLQRHRVRRKSIKLVLQPPLPRKYPHSSPDDFNNHLCSHSVRHFTLLGSYSSRPWSSLRMSPLLVEISAFWLLCPPQVRAQCLESSGTFCSQCGNLHHTHNHFVLTGSQQFSARPGCQLPSKSQFPQPGGCTASPECASPLFYSQFSKTSSASEGHFVYWSLCIYFVNWKTIAWVTWAVHSLHLRAT